eukprot:UC4_evm1s1444
MWDAFSRNDFGKNFAESGIAAHGAVSTGSTIPPGHSACLSIIFSWHFPDRDFSRVILGNMYTEFWQNSSVVANELASDERLADIVRDINSHHFAIAHPLNPTPIWLKDMLVNQWSHLHMLMWYKDGRLREYEAWSCDDVDSVHNDYQRHLLYLWGFPEFEMNKMEAWSTFAQDQDGHIWESLGYTGKPMDVGGGRLMGDTTSLYLLEMYEILLHSGNLSFIKNQWNSAKRAIDWMILNAGDLGLPQKLATTYDHFGFYRRTTVVYNAHIYLTSLEAARKMADILGDFTVYEKVSKAISKGQAKLVEPKPSGPLWNSSIGFFTAHSETTTQVFTDSLYGQMLSHHFFNGTLMIDEDILHKHLTYEWQQNQDKYGMR